MWNNLNLNTANGNIKWCYICCISVPKLCLFVTPWIAAHMASLSFAISQSLFQLMSTKSVMSSNHLISSCVTPFSSCPQFFPSIRVSSNESTLHIRWPKYWSSSFSISSSNEYSWLISFGLIGLISLQSKGLSRVFSSTIQKH